MTSSAVASGRWLLRRSPPRRLGGPLLEVLVEVPPPRGLHVFYVSQHARTRQVRLAADSDQQLTAGAERQQRTPSAVLRDALSDYLAVHAGSLLHSCPQ